MIPSNFAIIVTGLLLGVTGLVVAALAGWGVKGAAARGGHFQDNLRWRLGPQGIWLGVILVCLVLPVSQGLRVQHAHLFGDVLWSFRAPETPILVAPAVLLFAAGGLDLSVGAVASLVSAIVVYYSRGGMGNGMGILAALGVALGIGVVHGLAVTLARVPSVILTLGTMLLAGTAAGYVSGGETQMVTDGFPIPQSVAQANLLWIPVGLWIGLIAVLGALTPFRRRPGIEETETRLSRVFYLGLPYVLSSLGAAAVGILTLYRFRSNVTLTFTHFELEILAAVLLGGTCFDGRNAAVVGGVVASLTITAVNLLVIYTGVSSEVFTLLVGTTAVVAALWTHASQGVVGWLYGRRAGRAGKLTS